MDTFNTKELYCIDIKTTYNLEIGGKTFAPGETILHFDSLQLAVLEEFNKCNNAVRNAIGEPEYNSHLFRFPGGSNGGKYNDLKQGAKQLLSDNDILSVDWNSLSGDAEKQNPTPEYLMERIKSTSQDKSSLVILMHDAQAKKVTADTLPEIISYLKEQGYDVI